MKHHRILHKAVLQPVFQILMPTILTIGILSLTSCGREADCGKEIKSYAEYLYVVQKHAQSQSYFSGWDAPTLNNRGCCQLKAAGPGSVQGMKIFSYTLLSRDKLKILDGEIWISKCGKVFDYTYSKRKVDS